jgi:uncharacterized protein (TIGR03435 family)
MTPKAQRTLARIVLLALVSIPALAQSTGAASSVAQIKSGPAAPAFELADVHPTPPTTTPWMTGGMLHGERYLLHNATMVDMISLAYGVADENILGGPAWLDFDRFDISARAPRGTSPDDIQLMLRALLADRFKLVVHNDTHSLPSYVLRVEKTGPKFKQADESEPSEDQEHHTPTNLPPGTPAYYSVSGHNRAMAQLAAMLAQSASPYLPKPVVDATGLKGGWDFDLKWTWNPSPDGLSIFDALSRQLGLKLSLEQYPTPVVIVDSANQKPTPNPPGIDKALPPPPPAEFEVVVLKPSKPGAQMSAHITGDQITATAVTLKFFVDFAYNINENDSDLIVNAPKFFDHDHWDLLAKAAPEALATGPDGKPRFDFDLLPHMVQTMLNERFQMKSHLEDRTIDAFTLVAANPKMKKADPLNRSGCKEGPGPDGKDPRIANPILGRLLTCLNMTMAEFAQELPDLANGYVFTPLLDATGLTGAYDFTLSFSTAGALHSSTPPPPTGSNESASATTQSDPNGGLSLQDAIARQLGIKLEKRKRPIPVLVIDHIEQQPTEN